MEANPAINLKPLGMGQIIDRAVRLYRQNFVQYVGIVALAQIPMLIFGITFPLLTVGMSDMALNMTAESLIGLSLLSLISFLVGSILTLVAIAAMTQAIADMYMGRPTGIVEAFSRIGRTWIQLLWAWLLAIAVVIFLFIWTLIPCIGWLTGPGILFFVAVAVWPLLVPVIVLERCSATEAISRVWHLARRRFWWLLGFMLLLSILSLIVVSGPSTLLALAVAPLVEPFLGMAATNIVQTGSTSLLNVLYLPLYTACVVLVYFDLRVRTEGLDLALLAASRGTSEETAVSPTIAGDAVWQLPPAPPAPQGFAPTRDEWVYFLAITVGFVVLYIVLIGLLILIGAAMFAPFM
jgi:hypothetical protein